MRKVSSIVTILSFLLVPAAPTHAAVQFTVSDLGNFVPSGINASGDVIGWSSAAARACRLVQQRIAHGFGYVRGGY